jgi:hypothetical protein
MLRPRRGHREDAHVLRAQEVGGVRRDCLGIKATSSAHGIGCVLDQLLALAVQGHRQRAQGMRKGLPATTCQRSARGLLSRSSLTIGPRRPPHLFSAASMPEVPACGSLRGPGPKLER